MRKLAGFRAVFTSPFPFANRHRETRTGFSGHIGLAQSTPIQEKPVRNWGHRSVAAIDVQSGKGAAVLARRYPTRPRPAKPSSIMAQVDGSGTPLSDRNSVEGCVRGMVVRLSRTN